MTTPRAIWCAQEGLCVRCYLRTVHKRGTSRYAGSECALCVKTGYNRGTGICGGCLGGLQDATLDSIPSLARAGIANVKHDGRYKVTVSFPSSIAIVRERSLFIALRRAFPDAERPLSLREGFKLALGDRLDALCISYSADADLFIDVAITHPDAESETSFVGEGRTGCSDDGAGKKRMRCGSINSTTVVARVVDGMSDEEFLNAVGSKYIPPPLGKSAVQCTATISTGSVLLAGEYNKYSRIISQTPWLVPCDDGRPKYTKSVESVVCAGLSETFQPDRITFTAGGREDVDVRMLGNGRPFIVELVNPKIVPRRVTTDMLRAAVNASEEMSAQVVVNNLRIVPRLRFADMRVCESEKRKRYRCVVWTACHVAEDRLKDLLQVPGGFLLKQKTPLRVLHRRTLAVRERRIYQAYVDRVLAPRFFVLDIDAAAGTYIKEFVHGDHGRTVPNIAQLIGCQADILQLDVLGMVHTSTSG